MIEFMSPGTITELVEDARRSGNQVTVRLVRDWSERGLLDYPQKRPAGKGHGSKPALYTANQRKLFLALLAKRQNNGISSLARIPVYLWLCWGDDYVPLRQARRAFKTWLGDPRVSKQKAKDTAKAVLSQLDSPNATQQERRRLIDTLTDISYTGRVDLDQLKCAIRTVFEPDTVRVRRAIGHPIAPLTTEAVVEAVHARLVAAHQLHADAISDEAFLRARHVHLVTCAEYRRDQPRLAADGGSTVLYEAPTDQFMVENACIHLLTIVGLEILHRETQ